jgi:four helix bundle protein
MGERIRYHTDLRVWRQSQELALQAYAATSTFPRREAFGLTDQIRRAAASVPANIAEGCGRGTTQELIRSLRIARGSLGEMDSHLTLAKNLGYIRADARAQLESEARAIRLMLNALIAALARRRMEITG